MLFRLHSIWKRDSISSNQCSGVMAEVAENVSFVQVKKLDKKVRMAVENDLYQILWLEQGVKDITVDFHTHPSFPNSIIFLFPGKMLKLHFSCKEPVKGWIIQFSRQFFRDQYLEGFHIHNADVFMANGELPRIVLSPKIGARLNDLAEMISEIMQSQIPNKEVAASSLMKTLLVYCDSKCNIKLSYNSNNNHVNMVSHFKELVSKHLAVKHMVVDYALMMHVTPRYLNQVVKQVMGVTAKHIIQEQLLIQACRDLKFSNYSIKEISIKLGFSEPEHFSNFFKKEVGCSPLTYRQK